MCNKIYGQHKREEVSSDDSGYDDEEQEEHISPLEVGHNIYILAYKLSEHKKELKEKLDSQASSSAIDHYSQQTAQIEVGGAFIGMGIFVGMGGVWLGQVEFGWGLVGWVEFVMGWACVGPHIFAVNYRSIKVTSESFIPAVSFPFAYSDCPQ